MHAREMEKKQVEMKEEEKEDGRARAAREVEDSDSSRTDEKKEMKTVMTEEQIEILRRQISVFSFISHLLLHNTTFFCPSRFSYPLHPSPLPPPPGKTGSIWSDALMAHCCPSMTTSQRWAPTAAQLKVLECLFRQVNGTPSKEEIKVIKLVLAQHGQISETNVYNWFQNRRARSKRKRLKKFANNLETQVENKAVAHEENREISKSNPTRGNATLVKENEFHQGQGISPKVCLADPKTKEAEVTYPLADSSKSSTGTVNCPVGRTKASEEGEL